MPSKLLVTITFVRAHKGRLLDGVGLPLVMEAERQPEYDEG